LDRYQRPNPTCTATKSCFPDIPVSSVLFDKTDGTEKTYMAGTDIGVFITEDAGVTWQKFSTATLPAVPVYMIRQNAAGTVAATHGRGLWTIPKTGPINPPDSFVYTSSMNVEREMHTSTTLLDGRVLIAGGLNFNPNGWQATAEIYDPDAESFTFTGNMSTPRWGHAAVLLHNGKVLVLGGGDTGTAPTLASAEIFDPAGNGGEGSFAPTGMSFARLRPNATLLADGRVLVVGGTDPGGAAIPGGEIFDPAGNGGKGSFSPVGGLFDARYQQSSTLLDDGRVLVAGGIDFAFGPASPSAVAAVFDPASGPMGDSTPTGNLNFARDGHSVDPDHAQPSDPADVRGSGHRHGQRCGVADATGEGVCVGGGDQHRQRLPAVQFGWGLAPG